MLSVLETTRYVVEHSTFVRMNLDKLREVCRELVQKDFFPPEWYPKYHFFDGTERTVNWILVLDTLNFCFWREPKWRITYRGEVLDGYWALAASLSRAVEEGAPLWDADFLIQLTQEDLAYIFRGENEIPLLEERLKNLHEAGHVLKQKYQGQLTQALMQVQKSAVELARLLASDFSSFRDTTTYQGRIVKFYKRAQICPVDLYGSFGGQSWGTFTDLDQLTAFADYKLPQVLRHFGILEYEASLADKVDNKVLLPPGSPEEVEIRAYTIWAVERMRQTLAEYGQYFRAFEIDWYLWNLGQETSALLRPYHRTRTIYY